MLLMARKLRLENEGGVYHVINRKRSGRMNCPGYWSACGGKELT